MDQAPNPRSSTGSLLRRQSIQEILKVLEHEREWTEHYCWYLENVLSEPVKELSSSEHTRRQRIERLVPPARLAQWAEIAESPQELENLFAWMQGRLDLAQHLQDQFSDLDAKP